MTRSAILTALTLAAALAACQRPAAQPEGQAGAAAEPGLPGVVLRNRLRGVLLGTPQAKPDIRLTTVDGKPFSLVEDTKGTLTLLFFGYTHCPDVCPVHVANVGKVMKTLPDEVTSQIRFVFVTTDPERDTPERLKAWLANFHPGIIGLVGTPEQITAAQIAAGLLPSAKEIADSAAPQNYLVSHAAQVIAFTPNDDIAHIVYPFGVRQQDWANDLPILVNGWPE
jgi:protein SCO1/2